MKRSFVAVMMLAGGCGPWVGCASLAAQMREAVPEYSGLPQNAPLYPDLPLLISDSAVLQSGKVDVLLGLKDQNPAWQLRQRDLQVLPSRLQAVLDGTQSESMRSGGASPARDAMLETVKNPEPTYQGLVLTLMRSDGVPYAPLLFRDSKIAIHHGPVLAEDPGRRLEYWLFGTARIRRDLLLGSQLLPVLTFEQCRVLGNPIVATSPRQCLLPDQNILLETSEPLTRESLNIKDFDGCLKLGQALIYTFPRRCQAAGGRVFTEPPRVYENQPIQVGDKPQFMLGGMDAGLDKVSATESVSPSSPGEGDGVLAPMD